MKKITANVFTEDSYPGVIVGVVYTDVGMVLIDTPLRPDDGREWLADVRSKQNGPERNLVYLDSHPDRTLGGRAMESKIIAHEAVSKTFDDRPSIFKAQVPESGTEWETCTGLSGIRWASPNMAFTKQMWIHSGETEIVLEHHPGPEDGASWLIVPEEKVVFIGDLVTAKQPPFLAKADLEAWDKALELLSTESYQDYTIISSREGVVGEREIKEMRKFIGNVSKQMDRLGRRKSSVDHVEKLVDKLLGSFEFSTRYRNQYYQRVLHGLQHLYSNRYLTTK